MNDKRTLMPEQDPKRRVENFNEVALGYTDKMAQNESTRCLHCKHKPCVSACPVGVPIPDFICKVENGDLKSAYELIVSMNDLPAICGRVCPQENQCESKCVRGINSEPVAIGNLERYVADWFIKNCEVPKKRKISNGRKVAVIGSGPAGLVCASELSKLGYDVTIFEALHESGGVLMYGIPDFRLPKNIVRREISRLKNYGVKIETDVVGGKTLSIDDLWENNFKAIFIGTGAGLPKFMNIPGEGFKGVYSANEFLTRINLMRAYENGYDTPIIIPNKTVIIGGGNVAMDAARCAKRIGVNDVSIVYRRTEKEMPARREEIEHAKAEGINFIVLSTPTRIIGDENGSVHGIECIKMKLGDLDKSKRRSPIAINNSEFLLDADCIIVAIGNSPNPILLSETKGLKTNKNGCLIVNEETLSTVKTGIFAGGDAVTGAATVILAMGAGKKAASSIDEFLNN